MNILRVLGVACLRLALTLGLPALAAVRPAPVIASEKYALVVGVENYIPDQLPPLEYAEDDATALAAALGDLGFSAITMTSQAKNPLQRPATAAQIMEQVARRLEDRLPTDTVVLAFSGHGVQFKGDREIYFCPEQADLTKRESLVPMSLVMAEIGRSTAGRKLVLVDACRDELTPASAAKGGVAVELEAAGVFRAEAPQGTVALFSCKAKERSYELRDLQHSVFTHHVVEYLTGKAPAARYPGGELGVLDLASYVSSRTRETVDVRLSRRQTPEWVVPDGALSEWPLGTRRGSGRPAAAELASVDRRPVMGKAAADDEPATPLEAAVSAAHDEYIAGHWPESSTRARTLLAGLAGSDAAAHAARGDLLRLLAMCNEADAAEAVRAYDAAISAGKSTAAVLLGKGRALRLLDRDAEAVQCLDQSLTLRPDHVVTLESRGLAHMALHDNEAALADLSRAAALAPDAARYRITLASIYRRLGDVRAATATLEEAIGLANAAGDDCRRGEALAALRRHREAVEAQTAAISRDSRNLEALALRSDAYQQLHDAQAALADAREVARLDPTDAGHWLRIGTVERDSLHDTTAALASFDRGLGIAPRCAALLVARGRLKYGENDYAAARADIDAAAAVNPHLLEVHEARAGMHARRREFPEAIAAYDRLFAVVPRNPATLRSRAGVHITAGDEKRALADCDAALALLPPGDHASRARIQREAKRWPESIEAYSRAITADPADARLLHDRAWVYNETNAYDKAAADCRAGLAIDPDSDDLQEEMAYALKGTGNHDEAIGFFTKLIDMNPRGDAGLYEYRGDARMAKKEHAAARADYERACELEPDNPQHWKSLGKAHEADDDLDAALASFRRAAAIPPRESSRALEPGRMFYRKKKYDLAVKEFERITKDAPTDAAAWDWLGSAHREAGDLDAALAALRRAAAIPPRDSARALGPGIMFYKKKKYDLAVREFELVTKETPTDADAWDWLGAAHREAGDYEKSITCFDEAIGLAPGRAAFQRNRGSTLRKQKRFAEAIAAYDRAIAIDPSYADGFYWRGKCRDELDDVAGAEADFKEAVRLAPKDPFNKIALEGLQKRRKKAAVAAAAGRRAGEVTENSLGMKLVVIPAGEFSMGSAETPDELKQAGFSFADGLDTADERPVHKVRITQPFLMGVHEVTLGEFLTFYNDGYQGKLDCERDGKGGGGYDAQNSKKPFEQKPEFRPWSWGHPDMNIATEAGKRKAYRHPVVNVSWNDAAAFCEWLSRKEKKTYRLPTEAEWEYACRAGTTTRYWTGDDPEGLAASENVADGTAKAKFDWWTAIRGRDGHVFTSPVGSFDRSNPFGLHDMHGNVAEWCGDWYTKSTYADSPSADPKSPISSGLSRVFRGGSWNFVPAVCRSAYRGAGEPSHRKANLGFRVVCEIE